jgi:hypothetical protein
MSHSTSADRVSCAASIPPISADVPSPFGRVSEGVRELIRRHTGHADPEAWTLGRGDYSLPGDGPVRSNEAVRIHFPDGQRDIVSLQGRATVRIDGENTGIVTLRQGGAIVERNPGKLAIFGTGSLMAAGVSASWSAGSFPLAHAAWNSLIAIRAQMIATKGLGMEDALLEGREWILPIDEDNPRRNTPAKIVRENFRNRTFGVYHVYGQRMFGNAFDCRYLFPRHRLSVAADGYPLEVDLQARVMLDAEGRSVRIGDEPAAVGPFSVALGEWNSPQIHHPESGQLVRVGFAATESRGRILVMEQRGKSET